MIAAMGFKRGPEGVIPAGSSGAAASTARASAISRQRLPRWAWLSSGMMFLQYALVGIWLIEDKQYAIGDSLARTINAQVMVLSRDPHLGAMGFYWMPLPMLVRIPFVLVLAPLGEQVLAGPLSTALAAALVVPVLIKIGQELKLSSAAIVTLVFVYALNPVTVFSAANAMSEAMFSLFLALTFLGFLRFSRSLDVRDLVMIGAALAGGMSSRIEFIVITVGVSVACALRLRREQWGRAATMIGVPPFMVMAAWTLASSLIANDALYWYHEGKRSGTTPTVHPWMPSDLTLANVLGYVGYMVMLVAPVLAVAMIAMLLQRSARRTSLGLLVIVAGIPAFIALQLVMRTSWGNPRYFATMPLCGVVVAMWVCANASAWRPSWRRVLLPCLATASVLGAVVATYAYSDPVRTQIESESMFFASVTGRPLPEYQRRIDQLRPLIQRLDPELADGKFAVLDTRGGTALLLSEHPEQFIVPEDRDFEEIMSDPTGRFDYVVLPTVGLTSQYSATISGAMKQVTGGTFEVVEDYGAATLYEFKPSVAPVPDEENP